MKTGANRIRVGMHVLLMILAVSGIAGCISSERPTALGEITPGVPKEPEQTPVPTQQNTLLRITNGGSLSVEALTIFFPEDEIEFGDISAGTSTEYQVVPNGVYGYAAYRFELEGETILQPVIDWVGEVPLEGDQFTYVIDFDSGRSQWEMIRLEEVAVDD